MRTGITFYDPGLGTDIGATALTSPARFLQKLLASVTGRGITTNIADCFEFIINHYQPGDRIFLIGFSRGAYTVRCVANLLMLCGVPTKAETGLLLRFRKAVRDIAEDAVSTVLEHGAGHPRAEYEDERMEQARRFREKHGSNDLGGDVGRSNAAPYFIGVFDTVAALGAKGLLRTVLQIGFGLLAVLAIALISALPAAAILGVLHVFLSFHFWRAFFSALAVAEVVGGLYLWRRQRLSYRKTIRDFPKPSEVHSHYAEWKGENFDRLLSRFVHYARSANAVDEMRKDFDRVAWGGREEGAPEMIEGHSRLIQLWFAGNHSDVGGSYPEVESRLSDIALSWMIEQATGVPNGLKLGPVTVNGTKVPSTGDVGIPLHLFPAADGIQHCEIAGMRDTLDSRVPKFLRRFTSSLNWEEKVRTIKQDAPVHPTVKQRFEFESVVQSTGLAPYRPKALENHDEFKKCYSSRGANS